jgi:hypothetical protein
LRSLELEVLDPLDHLDPLRRVRTAAGRLHRDDLRRRRLTTHPEAPAARRATSAPLTGGLPRRLVPRLRPHRPRPPTLPPPLHPRRRAPRRSPARPRPQPRRGAGAGAGATTTLAGGDAGGRSATRRLRSGDLRRRRRWARRRWWSRQLCPRPHPEEAWLRADQQAAVPTRSGVEAGPHRRIGIATHMREQVALDRPTGDLREM